LLILLAAQKLAPALGAAKAASVATGLYVLHNVLYATLSMVAGWLADRFNKGPLLAAGYFLAALMALSYQASSLARYGRRSTHRSRSPTAHSCLLQAAGWF
jgi:MFS family permease